MTIREIVDDEYNDSLFVKHSDTVVDATLYVFKDTNGDKFTVWGAGYRNAEEQAAKEQIAANTKEWTGLEITDETVLVNKVGDYKPTHVADTDPIIQMIFGIPLDYIRKEI